MIRYTLFPLDPKLTEEGRIKACFVLYCSLSTRHVEGPQ